MNGLIKFLKNQFLSNKITQRSLTNIYAYIYVFMHGFNNAFMYITCQWACKKVLQQVPGGVNQRCSLLLIVSQWGMSFFDLLHTKVSHPVM